ncbi:siderophore-interacting protein [Agromyces sp. SYSU K20354]|uniref:siderophore-interacting protein n=1 Tax=Agromyces cavernae TaxID=2898659 RepID=UPI001E3360A0|nr:siderophore-interacting protein [Agromyces cavernae]MCD2443967.1 siderophore-interacting protein [Agromyces cavernae]
MAKPGYRVFDTHVGAIERMSPHFVRVTFRGDDLREVGWDGPDQRIKVILPLESTGFADVPSGGDWFTAWRALPDERRNPIRTYTIRDARPELGELDVDFVAHGDGGPASRWIGTAAIGARMLLVAPDATSDEPSGGWEWNPGAARTVLIAGDETAVPAVSAILEQLPADARGVAFLEVPEARDALDVRAPEGVDVRWLPRDSSSDKTDEYGARLVEAVRAWADEWAAADASGAGATSSAGLASEPPAASNELPAIDDEEILWEVPEPRDDAAFYAWLAGEASAITTLRRHLVKELGVDRRRVAFMGYWKLGRAEG